MLLRAAPSIESVAYQTKPSSLKKPGSPREFGVGSGQDTPISYRMPVLSPTHAHPGFRVWRRAAIRVDPPSATSQGVSLQRRVWLALSSKSQGTAPSSPIWSLCYPASNPRCLRSTHPLTCEPGLRLPHPAWGQPRIQGRPFRQYRMALRPVVAQMPQVCVLVHVIETDDPAGIEAYWHGRFAPRRLKGRVVRFDPGGCGCLQAAEIPLGEPCAS